MVCLKDRWDSSRRINSPSTLAMNVPSAANSERSSESVSLRERFRSSSSAVDVLTVFFGEKSAEIDAVADAAPDMFGDFDDDRDLDLRDWSAVQLCFGADGATASGCVRLDRERNDVIDLADVSSWTLRATGPR